MEEEALKFLLQYKEWVKYADLIPWLCRMASWAFTKFMYMLSRGSEEFLNKVWNGNTFFDKILKS